MLPNDLYSTLYSDFNSIIVQSTNANYASSNKYSIPMVVGPNRSK